jgi:hypothetical protein
MCASVVYTSLRKLPRYYSEIYQKTFINSFKHTLKTSWVYNTSFLVVLHSFYASFISHTYVSFLLLTPNQNCCHIIQLLKKTEIIIVILIQLMLHLGHSMYTLRYIVILIWDIISTVKQNQIFFTFPEQKSMPIIQSMLVGNIIELYTPDI